MVDRLAIVDNIGIFTGTNLANRHCGKCQLALIKGLKSEKILELLNSWGFGVLEPWGNHQARTVIYYYCTRRKHKEMLQMFTVLFLVQ